MVASSTIDVPVLAPATVDLAEYDMLLTPEVAA